MVVVKIMQASVEIFGKYLSSAMYMLFSDQQQNWKPKGQLVHELK
jgi:hypothetical protein